MTKDEAEDAPLDVVCLCAQWCGNCRDYQPVFDTMAARLGAGVRLVWIDIEDKSEVLGDVEIESFPTLLLLRGRQTVFLGPLTPQPGVLGQLVQTARDGRLPTLTDAQSNALAARVCQYLGYSSY